MSDTTDLVRNAIAGRIRLARKCGLIHSTVDWLGLVELITADVMAALPAQQTEKTCPHCSTMTPPGPMGLTLHADDCPDLIETEPTSDVAQLREQWAAGVAARK